MDIFSLILRWIGGFFVCAAGGMVVASAVASIRHKTRVARFHRAMAIYADGCREGRQQLGRDISSLGYWFSTTDPTSMWLCRLLGEQIAGDGRIGAFDTIRAKLAAQLRQDPQRTEASLVLVSSRRTCEFLQAILFDVTLHGTPAGSYIAQEQLSAMFDRLNSFLAELRALRVLRDDKLEPAKLPAETRPG